MKYGEDPQFGEPLARKLLDVFDDSRELLFSGRRCETQGLGIGALAYYRRAIEDEKRQLFDALIAAAGDLPNTENLVTQLKQGREAQSFQASIETIEAAWPNELKFDGEDPLSLLYRPLSVGLHQLDDAKCLQIATGTRKLLAEIAARLVALRQDRTELRETVKLLRNLAAPAD